MALVTLVGGLTPGFQPEMVPSSVAKMKMACLPGARRKSVGLPLKTRPVGADWVPGAKPGGGTVTTSGPPLSFVGCGFPLPSYRVDVPELLLATHQGLLPVLRVSPQGFLRLVSRRTLVLSALSGWEMSETKFFCLSCCADVTAGNSS